MCAAQLKTNSQSTFSSPRSLTWRSGPVCLSHPKPFSISHRRLRLIGVAGLPRGSAVEVAAAALVVPGHMRGHVQLPRGAHEILAVVSLVGAHGDAPRTALLLCRQHQQRGVALGIAIGMSHHRGGDQPVAVLHQRMAQIAQPRLLAIALLIQPGIGIGGRFMRLVGALLAAKVAPSPSSPESSLERKLFCEAHA